MKDALWLHDALTVRNLIRKGEITPGEVLDALEARIAAVDPLVNALPTLCFDRARETLSASQDIAATTLAGLPVPIKDSYAVAGVRSTSGSRVFEHHVPARSDFTVEAIERAGGLVYAKSNTPEFEAGANTFNEVFGSTLNPWDTSRSAAGSSGGAAVAVATGMAFVAQGSDFACSLRYPASFCGIVGLRPSPGLVPQGPNVFPWQSLSVAGPLARNVADTGLALSAMCRFDARDPLSRTVDAEQIAQAAHEPGPARFAYSPHLGIATVAGEIRKLVDAAAAKLEAAGTAMADASPDLSNADGAFRPLRAFQFAAMRAGLLEGEERALLKPEVVWNIEEGLKLSARDLADAERQRAHARTNMLDFLDSHEFLITPTAPVEPFPVGERYVERIEGQKMETYLDWLVLGYAVTVTGCPAISIPCGFTRGGLPVGMQIVARPYCEAQLLRFAAWCEAVLGVACERPIDPKAAAATADFPQKKSC